jgi:putative hemin transport protein
VTEAELVDSGRGSIATPLFRDAFRLFEAARALRVVKTLVRNDFAVLERPGAIEQVVSDGRALSVADSSFHFRMQAAALNSAVALRETGRSGTRRSLQLFDACGASIAKLVLRPESDVAAFDRICAQCEDSAPLRAPRHRPRRSPKTSQGEALVPGALAAFLNEAATLGVPLQIRVSNDASTLTTQAAIHRIKRSEHAPWINVLDPALDLHLFEEQITRLATERTADGSGAFHWFSAAGEPAFSIVVSGPVERLVAAATSSRAE